MSKKKKEETVQEQSEAAQESVQEPVQEPEMDTDTAVGECSELEKIKQEQAQEHDMYLRLAAEYENFRKRAVREKDGIYLDAVAQTIKTFLPVHDNLERAMCTETTDEAYKKGVEMTMTELKKIFSAYGVEAFGAPGDPFDPQRYNAVMHIEDETLAENTVAEVFQTGFAMKERIIRFAMVKVAN